MIEEPFANEDRIDDDPHAALVEAARRVLEGFDRGIFIRSIAMDHAHGAIFNSAPYLVALGRLKAFVDKEDGV